MWGLRSENDCKTRMTAKGQSIRRAARFQPVQVEAVKEEGYGAMGWPDSRSRRATFSGRRPAVADCLPRRRPITRDRPAAGQTRTYTDRAQVLWRFIQTGRTGD